MGTLPQASLINLRMPFESGTGDGFLFFRWLGLVSLPNRLFSLSSMGSSVATFPAFTLAVLVFAGGWGP